MPFLIVESDWIATNAPLTPTIFPNMFSQSLEIAILFKVVESSGNYVVKEDKPPRAPRAKVVSSALGAYKVFIDRVVVKLQMRLIQFEIERASALCNSRKGLEGN